MRHADMMYPFEPATYRRLRTRIFRDPEFGEWFENDYVPIAGGWQY